MKLTINITGQDQNRLAERVEQLVRARAMNALPPIENDAPPSTTPPTARRPPRQDRRS